MSDREFFIHLFKTRNSYYIYDVGTDVFLKVPKHTYDALEKCTDKKQELEELARQDSIIRSLMEQNYLLASKAEEIIHPSDNLIPYYLDSAIEMLTLQITQQCNLRCSYCTYSGDYLNRSHSNQEMTIETAKKGIDFLINHSKDLNFVSIAFYGGEPLLRFDFIKECINYAKQRGEGKEIKFSMTTNGTLLNSEIVEFLQSNHLNLTISLDGPKEIHDKNRKFINGSGTFDKILSNIEGIMKNYPEYLDKYVGFNVVIDGNSELGCISNFFMNSDVIRDLNIHASEVNGLYTDKEIQVSLDYIEKISYEKFKIMLEKIGKLDKQYTSRLFSTEFEKIRDTLSNYRTHKSGIPRKIHHGGPCLPGVNRLFMSTQGVFYPCERVSETSEPMKIGHVDVGLDISKVRELLNIGKLTEDKCKNCWAFRYCYLCAAFSDDINSLSKTKKALYCTGVQSYVENIFIIYCTMREFGYDFEDPYMDNFREVLYTEVS